MMLEVHALLTSFYRSSAVMSLSSWQVVLPSVCKVYHTGWNTSKISSRLISLGSSLSLDTIIIKVGIKYSSIIEQNYDAV